jgi:hypothetical protein
MIDRLAGAQALDLLAMSSVIGGLVFTEEAEKQWFKRRFTMFQDLIQESWIYHRHLKRRPVTLSAAKGRSRQVLSPNVWAYQELGGNFFERGLEKGRVEGRIQEPRQILMSFLQTRFPETLALANQQTKSINDPEVLPSLLTKLFAAQTVEEARQILLDVNRQRRFYLSFDS